MATMDWQQESSNTFDPSGGSPRHSFGMGNDTTMDPMSPPPIDPQLVSKNDSISNDGTSLLQLQAQNTTIGGRRIADTPVQNPFGTAPSSVEDVPTGMFGTAAGGRHSASVHSRESYPTDKFDRSRHQPSLDINQARSNSVTSFATTVDQFNSTPPRQPSSSYQTGRTITEAKLTTQLRQLRAKSQRDLNELVALREQHVALESDYHAAISALERIETLIAAYDPQRDEEQSLVLQIRQLLQTAHNAREDAAELATNESPAIAG